MIDNKSSQNKSFSVYRMIISTLYILVIITMGFIILLNIILKTPNGPDQYGLQEFSSMTDSWTTSDGTI